MTNSERRQAHLRQLALEERRAAELRRLEAYLRRQAQASWRAGRDAVLAAWLR